MPADIAQGSSIRAVTLEVNKMEKEGWTPSGSPFFDANRNEWCWAVVRHDKPVAPGGVKLREPQRRLA